MEKKKSVDVTIIVPVYNVDKYLRNCLESLVNQDYDKNKFEIYLINDNSKDNSLDIIEEYAGKYNNITIYNLQKNLGVSNARNIGIENARGEYLIFCDADDMYASNTISVFMEVIKKSKADFIMANHYITINNKNIAIHDSDYFKSSILTKEEIISYLPIASWAKIIKKSLFINNDILYPIGIKRYEELNVIPKLAFLAKKAMVIPNFLYYYVQRKTSASNNNSKSAINEISSMLESCDFFEKDYDNELYKEEIEFRIIDQVVYGSFLVMLKMHVDKKTIRKEIDRLTKKYPNMLANKYLNNYSFRKKIFVKLIVKKHIFAAKVYAKAHQLFTG